MVMFLLIPAIVLLVVALIVAPLVLALVPLAAFVIAVIAGGHAIQHHRSLHSH